MNLRKLVSGNKKNWDKFVEDMAPLIGAAARSTLQKYEPQITEEDINEVISEVFLKLVKNEFSLLRRFDPSKAGMKTWLSVITRSTAIDNLRQRRPPETSLDESIESPGTKDVEQALPSYPSDLLTSTQNQVMHHLIEEARTVPETAAALGVTDQTVRSQKSKAVARLRRFYGVTSSP